MFVRSSALAHLFALKRYYEPGENTDKNSRIICICKLLFFFVSRKFKFGSFVISHNNFLISLHLQKLMTKLPLELLSKLSSKSHDKNLLLIQNWLKIIFLSILFNSIFPDLYKSSLAESLTSVNNSKGFLSQVNSYPTKPSDKNDQGQDILNEIMKCVENKMNGYTRVDIEHLSANWNQCSHQVLTLATDGSVRPDASSRTIL
jgi:hypothetical protein